MLRVISDCSNVLITCWEENSIETFCVRDGTFLPQLLPDRIRILRPLRIKVIEIAGPIRNRFSHAHADTSLHSRTSIAASGQFAAASRALLLSSRATAPPPVVRA